MLGRRKTGGLISPFAFGGAISRSPLRPVTFYPAVGSSEVFDICRQNAAFTLSEVGLPIFVLWILNRASLAW